MWVIVVCHRFCHNLREQKCHYNVETGSAESDGLTFSLKIMTIIAKYDTRCIWGQKSHKNSDVKMGTEFGNRKKAAGIDRLQADANKH